MALDTNWRENTGTFVCARSGNDASGDGSKASPYKTLNYIGTLSGTYNLRAGFYTADLIPINSALTLIGDGQVIVDGSGATQFFSMNQNDKLTLINILLQNGVQSFSSTADNGSVVANDCVFDNVSFRYKYSTFNAPPTESLRCLYKNGSSLRVDRSSTSGTFLVFRHTFADTTTVISATMAVLYQNCFFAKNSGFSTGRNDTSFLNTAFEATLTNQCTLNSVNIKDITLDGETNTIGNTYASDERFSGTATVGGLTVTFTNCFYTDDPMFNDAANEDYTLQSNLSPLFNNGNIIGCYGVADKFDLSHPAFQTANGATYTNISGLDANGDPVGGSTPLGIASGTDAMFSTSNDPTQCFTLSDTITITDPVQWFGQFIYDNSGNGKWIDTANYDEVNNPEVRLTYGIQFYDENEPNPNTLDNWSKTYQMEVNMPIERDGSASGGLGNGNVDADLQNLGAITFKRFRLVDVTLRNNGV